MAGEQQDLEGNERGEPSQQDDAPPPPQQGEEEMDDGEYEALDRQLDQLHSCLDVLEQQNDALHAQLKDLLESNRQARREFLEENQQSVETRHESGNE